VTPPSFCLIKAILALAFRNMAFASKSGRDPGDVYSVDIPDRLQSVSIKWAENWKKVSVLRRSVRDSMGKAYTSPELASTVQPDVSVESPPRKVIWHEGKLLNLRCFVAATK
jgi:hypothetical protein